MVCRLLSTRSKLLAPTSRKVLRSQVRHGVCRAKSPDMFFFNCTHSVYSFFPNMQVFY